MYRSLVMPWDGLEPVASLPKSLYVRRDFDVDGVPSNGKEYFGGSINLTFEQAKKRLGTGSPIVRWREAHPDLVGTKDDILNKFVEQLKEVSGGKDSLVMAPETAILLFKKQTPANTTE